LLSRNLEPLAKLGIEAEPFGANTLKVDALPAFLHSDDPAALLSQIVDELASLSSKSSSLRFGGGHDCYHRLPPCGEGQ